MTWPVDAAERISLLSSWLTGTDIAVLELITPEERIRVTRDGITAVAHHPPPPGTDRPDAESVVTAPSVGVFRQRHPLRPGTLAQAGQAVRLGEAVGLLQIGLLLLAVEAPHDGTIGGMLAEDGVTVGYGTPLVRLLRKTRT